MPETAGAGAAAPDPTVRVVPGWAQTLLDQGVDEATVQAAIDRQAADDAGPPPTPEQRADAATALRAQAELDVRAAKAAAEHTRLHGQSLIEHARAQAAKAQEDYDRDMANADRIEAGDPPIGPPEAEAEPAPGQDGEGM